MAREATQAELLAVYEADWQDVTAERLQAALRFMRSEAKDECHWARVEMPESQPKIR